MRCRWLGPWLWTVDFTDLNHEIFCALTAPRSADEVCVLNDALRALINGTSRTFIYLFISHAPVSTDEDTWYFVRYHNRGSRSNGNRWPVQFSFKFLLEQEENWAFGNSWAEEGLSDLEINCEDVSLLYNRHFPQILWEPLTNDNFELVTVGSYLASFQMTLFITPRESRADGCGNDRKEAVWATRAETVHYRFHQHYHSLQLV